jgi:hypothetical protein
MDMVSPSTLKSTRQSPTRSLYSGEKFVSRFTSPASHLKDARSLIERVVGHRATSSPARAQPLTRIEFDIASPLHRQQL